jgi:alkyldihydroxyacetonephosphate synthase
LEFSTVGGWVSTRASGMKKNVYGNIEDMLINLRICTPNGVVTKKENWSRLSSGPCINEIFLGSEGNFGIITDVVLRVRKMPEVRKF